MIAPLVPAIVDLTDFEYMPLLVARLRTSLLTATMEPATCWSALLLWAASWHEIPASSLPDDNRLLAAAANYGRDVRGFMKIRKGALHKFVLCSDGRFYHPLVAEKALEAWLSKLAARISSGEGNLKRWGTPFDRQPIDLAIATAAVCLRNLNPNSRSLAKRNMSGLPITSHRDPDGIPDSIPSGSQGKGSKGNIKPNPPHPTGVSPPLEKKKPESYGTRLPRGWVLPKRWGVWALQEAPAWDAQRVRAVADKFRDHWHGKAGKDARKADWLATWRNWVREELQREKRGGGSGKIDQRAETVAGLTGGIDEPDNVIDVDFNPATEQTG